MFLEKMEGLQEAGEEEINGTMTTKITGILSGDAMKEVAATSGLTETAETMGVHEDAMESVYEALGDIPVSLWIDAEGYVWKYELELTELMQKIMESAMMAVGLAETDIAIDVLKTNISMVCSEFNGVGEIIIPEDVKSVTMEDLTDFH